MYMVNIGNQLLTQSGLQTKLVEQDGATSSGNINNVIRHVMRAQWYHHGFSTEFDRKQLQSLEASIYDIRL